MQGTEGGRFGPHPVPLVLSNVTTVHTNITVSFYFKHATGTTQYSAFSTNKVNDVCIRPCLYSSGHVFKGTNFKPAQSFHTEPSKSVTVLFTRVRRNFC